MGDKVTLEVIEVVNRYGETIVRGRYDGEYDKTGLPEELILTRYFTIRHGKIVSHRDTQHARLLTAGRIMSTHVVTEFYAQPGRGEDLDSLSGG